MTIDAFHVGMKINIDVKAYLKYCKRADIEPGEVTPRGVIQYVSKHTVYIEFINSHGKAIENAASIPLEFVTGAVKV